MSYTQYCVCLSIPIKLRFAGWITTPKPCITRTRRNRRVVRKPDVMASAYGARRFIISRCASCTRVMPSTKLCGSCCCCSRCFSSSHPRTQRTVPNMLHIKENKNKSAQQTHHKHCSEDARIICCFDLWFQSCYFTQNRICALHTSGV